MPRRYQNGALLIREDVARPYWYVKVTIPVIDEYTGKKRKKRVEEKLGFVDETTRDQALKLRADTLEMVNAHRTIALAQIRFKDVARRFLDIRVPQLGVATQNKYKLQLKNHLVPYFGEMRLHEIDRPAIEQFMVSKVESLSWWSRVDLKGVLSAVFTTAKDWKLYEGDLPTTGAKVGSRKKLARAKRLLTAAELNRIFSALDDECRFIARMLFGLGLNISEALGLRWSDLDLDAGTVTIARRWYRGHLSEDGELKTENRGATLALGTILVDELKRRRSGKPEDFVFIGDDGKNPPDDRDLLRERFRPVVKRLGLYYPGFGWHAFRRQNITWRQTVGGATPLEAQRAARHGSLDMTLLYTLEDLPRQADQVDAMFAKLMETPEGAKQN